MDVKYIAEELAYFIVGLNSDQVADPEVLTQLLKIKLEELWS